MTKLPAMSWRGRMCWIILGIASMVSRATAQKPFSPAALAEAARESKAATVKEWARLRELVATPFKDAIDHAEASDEQRFFDADEQAGPIAHVYLRDEAEYRQEVKYAKLDAGSAILLADVFVDDTTEQPLSLPYTNLFLAKGNNCVYVYRRSESLHAFLRPDHSGDCDRTATIPGPQDPQLQGIGRLRNLIVGHNETPVAARFDEDMNGLPTIVLKVERGELELARDSLKIRPIPDNQQETKRYKIWHDRQKITVRDQSTGKLVQKYLATIEPVSSLEGANSTIPFEKDFADAAMIYFPTSGTAYSKKFGFESGVNYLQLRYVASESGDKNTHGWHARVRSPNGKVTPELVVFDSLHVEGSYVPGTARWAWSDGDEAMWVRCPAAGCCRVSAIGQFKRKE